MTDQENYDNRQPPIDDGQEEALDREALERLEDEKQAGPYDLLSIEHHKDVDRLLFLTISTFNAVDNLKLELEITNLTAKLKATIIDQHKTNIKMEIKDAEFDC